MLGGSHYPLDCTRCLSHGKALLLFDDSGSVQSPCLLKTDHCAMISKATRRARVDVAGVLMHSNSPQYKPSPFLQDVKQFSTPQQPGSVFSPAHLSEPDTPQRYRSSYLHEAVDCSVVTVDWIEAAPRRLAQDRTERQQSLGMVTLCSAPSLP